MKSASMMRMRYATTSFERDCLDMTSDPCWAFCELRSCGRVCGSDLEHGEDPRGGEIHRRGAPGQSDAESAQRGAGELFLCIVGRDARQQQRDRCRSGVPGVRDGGGHGGLVETQLPADELQQEGIGLMECI